MLNQVMFGSILSLTVLLIYLPKGTYSYPYRYYGAYSRTRRDPTSWDNAYTGIGQQGHVPVIPNTMGVGGVPNYGGHVDSQGVGMGGSFGQETNPYGVNQYGTMDNSMRNSQHSTMGGGLHSQTDLKTYQQSQQSQYPSQAGGAGNILPMEGLGMGDSDAPDECRGVQCQSLLNCLDVDMNATKCCPKCKTYGCVCEGYQIYDCQQNGFSEGTVPAGKSYRVADGTTVCSCPPGGGSITCSYHDSTAKCPELPPNCISPFVREIDGCQECAMIGCLMDDGKTKVQASMAVQRSSCQTCFCPPGGGEVLCGFEENCDPKTQQQKTDSLAMESSIREINSLGHSSEAANGYGGYPYGSYPDYGNQYGQNPSSGTSGSPAIPPVVPLATGSDGSTTDKETGADSKSASSDRSNAYGNYQGYNMPYANQYGQYASYGQTAQGYGGNYMGYGGNYGYNQGYAQNGYPPQGVESSNAQNTDGSNSLTSASQPSSDTGAGGYQQGGYPYQGAYGQYGSQQAYVPPLSNGYSSYPIQDPSVGSQSASDVLKTNKPNSPDKNSLDATSKSTADSQNYGGYGYQQGNYGQNGYYQQGGYQPYPGYDPYQQHSQLSTGSDAESAKSPESASNDKSTKQDAQSAMYGQQGYGNGELGQYVGGYDPYNYASQYGYQQPQTPGGMGTVDPYGAKLPGQETADSKSVSDSSQPSSAPDKGGEMSQYPTVNGRDSSYQNNFHSFYPHGSQQGQGYPSQTGSQYQPMDPSGSPGNSQQPIESDGAKDVKETKETKASGSRQIRHNTHLINKGRLTHHKSVVHVPSPPTTTSTTTTTTPTTTTRTTTTTTRPTTTTTTTTKPKTTTTTTRPTTTRRTTTTTTRRPTTTTTTRNARRSEPKKNKNNSELNFEIVLNRCCKRGQQWAVSHAICAGQSASITGTLSKMCAVAQEKCCMEAKQQQNCQAGMDNARSLSMCIAPSSVTGTCGANEYKTCCDCCEMGLKAVGLGLSCDVKMFGEQCNKAYKECCQRSMADTVLPPIRLPEPTTTTSTTTTTTTTPKPSGPRCATDSECQQICDDTSDGMVCSCRKGYRLHVNKMDCVDVNECVLNTHTCTEHEICLNRVGTFFCQRRISCGTGYELTERNTCEDIDECELNIHDCLANMDCRNVRGSYKCIPKLCDAGFFTDATGRCIDIDECRARDFVCPKGATCMNTAGSYECKCPIGLTPNAKNTLCEDVNECENGEAGCGEGATCINTVGSFVCRDPPKIRCSPGYVLSRDLKSCQDIDECTEGTHTCKRGSTCINEDGGFRCEDPLVCPDGLKADADGRLCLDINECEDPSLHRCNEGGKCVNLAKTFKCVCDSGYDNSLTTDGLPTCKDVDECSSSIGESCKYKCKNLPGSYECFCPDGFKSANFGATCDDVDECAASTSPCLDGQTCFNTHGDHRCVSLECPSGYTKISNTRRCSRRSCRGKPRSCLKQPKQISFHNISLSNGTNQEKPLFRMSLARSHSTDRYEFLLTDGNVGDAFKVKSSTRIKRPTGVVYTAEELVGPKDYVLDLSLKLYRGRRWSLFISRLYIFVGAYDL
ncbi:uncharacterized protein LOC120328917 isoform X1 [Styela clava]